MGVWWTEFSGEVPSKDTSVNDECLLHNRFGTMDRTASNGANPGPTARDPGHRQPTIISQTASVNRRISTVSKRSSKGIGEGSVTRVYSIGSCPACKNGRMNSCKICEGRSSAPVEDQHEEDEPEMVRGGIGSAAPSIRGANASGNGRQGGSFRKGSLTGSERHASGMKVADGR